MKNYSSIFNESDVGYGITVAQFSPRERGDYKYFAMNGHDVEEKQFIVAGTSKYLVKKMCKERSSLKKIGVGDTK